MTGRRPHTLARLVALLIVGMLAASGCRFTVHSSSNRWSDRGWLEDATKTKHHVFEIGSKIDSLRFRLEAKATNGRARWTLRSPDGTIVTNAEITAGGSVDHGADLPPTRGRWTIETELVDYSGSYAARLHAKGGSSHDFVVIAAPEVESK